MKEQHSFYDEDKFKKEQDSTNISHTKKVIEINAPKITISLPV